MVGDGGRDIRGNIWIVLMELGWNSMFGGGM